jgi:hypothetical protein
VPKGRILLQKWTKRALENATRNPGRGKLWALDAKWLNKSSPDRQNNSVLWGIFVTDLPSKVGNSVVKAITLFQTWNYHVSKLKWNYGNPKPFSTQKTD